MDRNDQNPDMVPIENVGSYLERRMNEDGFVMRVLEPLEKLNMKLIQQMEAYGMPRELIEEAKDAAAQATNAVLCLVDELTLTNDRVVPRRTVDLILRYCDELALRELVQLLREIFGPGAR